MEEFICGPMQRSPMDTPSPSGTMEANPAMFISESLSELSPGNSVSTLPSEEMQDKPSVQEKISVASMLETKTGDEMFLKKQLRYLFHCYERVATEERSYPKVPFQKLLSFQMYYSCFAILLSRNSFHLCTFKPGCLEVSEVLGQKRDKNPPASETNKNVGEPGNKTLEHVT